MRCISSLRSKVCQRNSVPNVFNRNRPFARAVLVLALFLALILHGIELEAETLHVPLPDLVGSYSDNTRVAAFDIGIQLDSVISVAIHWSGTLTPGLGHGDGVELPWDYWFPWPTQLEAIIDPPGPGFWYAYTGPVETFDDTEFFEDLGNLSWDFLLDGQGEVEAALAPAIIIGGIMVTPPTGQVLDAELIINAIPSYICGDADGSGAVDIDDAIYLIMYVYLNGPMPIPTKSGDVNCDDRTNLLDIANVVNYLFRGGNTPCDPNGDGVPDC